MKRETLIETLRSDSKPLTQDEAIELIEKELDKAHEEADGDLIDLCLEILAQEVQDIPDKKAPDIDTLNRQMAEMLAEEEAENRKAETKDEKKHRNIRFGRILALVAVITVLAGIVTTVSADYFNIDASEKIVRFVKGRFIVNLSDDDSVDLPLMFEEYELENIVLPEVFYNQDLYKITDFECEKTEIGDVNVYFSIESLEKEINAGVTIFSRKETTNFLAGKLNVYNNTYNKLKCISDNGINVLVFQSEHTKSSVITYVENNVEYNIEFLNCEPSEVLNIAKTIIK